MFLFDEIGMNLTKIRFESIPRCKFQQGKPRFLGIVEAVRYPEVVEDRRRVGRDSECKTVPPGEYHKQDSGP